MVRVGYTRKAAGGSIASWNEQDAAEHGRLPGCAGSLGAGLIDCRYNKPPPAVLAYLKARVTQYHPAGWHIWKLRLVRGLYERGFSAKDVRELFRLIDWLMELPPPLELVFDDEVANILEERRMPYVTSIERVAIRRALWKGIATVLKVRFGEEGLKLMPEINDIHEQEQLERILTTLETAASPEEVRRLWSAG